MTRTLSSSTVRAAVMVLAMGLPATVLATRTAPPPAHGDDGIVSDNANTPARLPGTVTISQKPDALLPMDLIFRDSNNKAVRLKDLFRGKPVLLNFVYYRCPMLCSMVLDGMTNTMTEMKLDIGTDYDVITVSIDPRDTVTQAAEKKDKYVRLYGRLQSAPGWHFLVGHESSIKQLTSAVGFQYAYDPQADQFAHGAVLISITPEGRISRYFYGFEYKARDVRLGLVEASAGKIGKVTDQILLLCYHYDPATGKYSRKAMNFARAGGVVTMFGLGGFIFVMFRRERQRESGMVHKQ